jgi:hypothetical protein
MLPFFCGDSPLLLEWEIWQAVEERSEGARINVAIGA